MRTGRLLVTLALASLAAGCLGGDDADDVGNAPPETMTLYFSRDSEDCAEVEAVSRTAEGEVTLELALRELLAGPNPSERAGGFGSWFSADTAGMVRSVEVDDGVARVSFDGALASTIPNASSSCGSANLLAQLDATVRNFDGVDRAIYDLDGDVNAFYTWLGLEPPAD